MSSRFTRICAALTAGAAATAVLAACGGNSKDDGTIDVVASTSAWGSIATVIAGPDAKVTSIVTDPAADPHSFETTPADTAKISDADLVVFNGAHYDEFIEKAIEGKKKPSIEAFALRADKADENEHVWYDIPTVSAVADQIAVELGKLDSAHAAGYTERANAFKTQLIGINTVTASIATAHANAPVVQTEPIAHYLLKAAGVDDRTPHEFQEAIEQETDPSPASVAATRELLTSKTAKALIYNTQTQDKITKDLRDVAAGSQVRIVEVTETLPVGLDYVAWLTANAKSLALALR
ncbi:metal ABC transporter solute-binding protein, Zn/Mn family [Nocardia camponoti]|uniref:ABC transporter solute binding protein n=1 Tax=Nocardia camponoti TaxID=1616106 RepID=A0A917QMW6_9NOCA|nr:zinc ABC transporter substrate-binding protein [Nocardia camponoti]GGK59973.1 putative ABC transporter solute binding protein [Nocardia camponoti]